MAAATDSVAAQMRECIAQLQRATPADVKSACGVIYTKAADRTRLDAAVAATVPDLVDLIKAHPEDVTIVAAASMALSCITGHPCAPASLHAGLSATDGLIPALFKALRANIRDSSVAAGVAGSLANIARTVKDAASIISEGGCELAVEVLRAHLSGSTAMEAAPAEAPCLLLVNLSKAAADKVAGRVVRAGGIPVILAAMRSYCRVEDVVDRALAIVLASLNAAVGVVAPDDYLLTVRAVVTASSSTTNVMLGIALLLRALIASTPPATLDLACIAELAALILAGDARRDEAVADHAIAAIHQAFTAVSGEDCHDWPASVAGRFAAAGGVPCLVAAVRAHAGHREIAFRGCLLLTGLASNYSKATDVADAAHLCISVLRAHPDSLAVFGAASSLAAVLCENEHAKPVLLKGGFIGLFMATCSKSSLSPNLLGSALHAVAILVLEAQGAEQAVAARVPPLAVTLLRTHGSDYAVARNACGVLGSLVIASEVSSVAPAWLDSTFIPALLSTWKQHPDDCVIICGACMPLARLCSSYANAQAVEAASGIELAVTALRTHVSNADAPRAAARLIEALAATLGHRSKFVAAGAPAALALPLRHHPTIKPLIDAVCDAFSELVQSASLRDNDCTKGPGPALVHFFDLAACSDVVGTGVAELLVPTLAAMLERERDVSSSGRCSCKHFALLNMLAASKAGVAAFAGIGAGCRTAVDVVRGRLAVCAGAQRYARATVCHLAVHPRLRAQMIADGAVKPLLGSLKSAGELVASSQRLSLGAVVRLASDAPGQAAIMVVGGMKTLCDFLQRTSSRIDAADGSSGSGTMRTPTFSSIAGDEGAVVDALRVVTNLARSPDAQAGALKAGLLPLLVSFLYTGNSPTVVQAGCAALRAYAIGDGCDRHAVDAGAVAALVDVLRDFSTEAGVVEEACAATWNLVAGGDAVCVRAARTAALDVLRGVVTAHPADSAVGRCARGALACLA